jgi:hypothetical protein
VITRERVLTLGCLLFASAIFVTGIGWGLPSRDADPYLFGTRTPWTGREILDLTGDLSTDPAKGADVDLNPLADRSQPIVLNATDAQRAEIVRRYRLFTYQPDEWNTMRSLAGMKPRQLQLDPRLYQYGGLWVYPIGALLKVSFVFGLIHLSPDLAFYLDHPEAFARFYIVARLYSAAWGVVGAWAVYMLTRKLTGQITPAAIACICWAMMPVVINMAHEAKPHLAGLSLTLLAVLASSRYVETGTRKWWIIAGGLCGAALGMVISSLVVFVILPLMTLLRRDTWRERIRVTLLSTLVGFAVYAVTNPYFLINLFRNPQVLRSNLGTSTAMYQATAGNGLLNAIKLLAEGASPGFLLLPVLFLLLLLISSCMRKRVKENAQAKHLRILLSVPALLVAIQFIALASGKPGEYGRFGLLVATLLCMKTVIFPWLAMSRRWSNAWSGVAVAAVIPFAAVYLMHFVADASWPTSRILEARRLSQFNNAGLNRIALAAEPAPYATPPVDLWQWEMILLPRGKETPEETWRLRADVFLRAVDDLPLAVKGEVNARLPSWPDLPLLSYPARISWAAKPIESRVGERRPASAAADSAAPTASSPSPAPAAP